MTINHPHLLEDADFTSQLPILFIPADPHPRRRPARKLSVGHERMISQFYGHLASWWRYVYFCFPPDFSQRCRLLEALFVGKPSHDFQAEQSMCRSRFSCSFKRAGQSARRIKPDRGEQVVGMEYIQLYLGEALPNPPGRPNGVNHH
jgi:hypothetical protein